jgi:hypothetical protein
VPRTTSDPREALRHAERAAHRRELPTLVGLIAFGLLIAVAGRGEPAALGVGAWIAGVGGLLLVGRVLRDREARGAGPRGRFTTRTLDGEPATVLHQHPARWLVGPALSAWATVPFVALVLGGARSAGSDAGLGAGVLLTALLVPVGLVVGGQVRRTLRAGVWLTPSALVVRERDVTSRVPWADVRRITDADRPAAPVRVVARDRSAVTVVARRRSEARFRAALGDVLVPTGSLPLDAPDLVALLRRCAQPGGAAALGTDAGLALVRGARHAGR